MPSFVAGAFAVAGLAAALGAVLVHLLNRRRHRVVRWAAMDFLREARERHRRMLRLRDVLLLAVRSLAVALFGLALARPYFPGAAGEGSGGPVHAVLVVDDSLSMAYEELGGTLLERSKARARELIARLPEGSWVSIVPLCGPARGSSRDAYRSREDALDALEAVQAVDRQGSAGQALDLALEAARRVTEVPSKRLVFIGDQQRVAWPSGALGSRPAGTPVLDVVDVSAVDPENSWVADLRLPDGVADAETPAVLAAEVRHEGRAPRPGVPVTLEVDRVAVASRIVDLEPGQTREVVFTHLFAPPASEGRPAFAAARVSIPPDRLPLDDERVLAVPVAAGLPAVFVDQLGEAEDPAKGLSGETRSLRRLLAPAADGAAAAGGPPRAAVRIRKRRAETLAAADLEGARIAVVAGVEDPSPAVPLLRAFAERG
ncbi:MAG: BatA domain-containing protein, partial [Planctomycetes bacterium]|nr:BatA domain-containing protein [Planctomycetota bacterium]